MTQDNFNKLSNDLQQYIQPKMSKYIPCIPTPKQQVFLWIDDLDVFFGGSLGGGKVLMDGTHILTPFGFKKAEELKVGDIVNNPDGGVSKIIQVHAKQEYEKWIVKFHDGSEIITTGGHLWKAWRSGKSRKVMNKLTFGEDGAEIVETKTLKKWLDSAIVQAKRGVQANWPVIPVCQEQVFNITYKHPSKLDPYLLGYLIGDGSLRKEGIRITSVDHEHIKKYFSEYDLKLYSEDDYGFRGESLQFVRNELEKLKLLGEKSESKFIPRQFKYGSIECRYSILQGLMDTDGTCDSRGQLYFTSVSKELIDDFLFILQSLGGLGTTFTKQPYYTGKNGDKIQGQTAYTIYIKHPHPEKLFRLQRKRERALSGVQDIMFRRIESIEVGGKAEGRCITVSHLNGLYLTDSFIVTHNSQALLMAALQYTDIPFYNALLIRDTYANLSLPESLMFRSHEWLNKTDVRWNGVDKMWVFPSGATLSFGYLDKPTAHFNYMSAEYQFIGIDEIVSIRENQATFLFSRMRKKTKKAFIEELTTLPKFKNLSKDKIEELALAYEQMPLRFRSASNPPLPEQMARGAWVKKRYVDEKTRGDRIFIPAKMDDNPHLEKESYLKTLKKGLDPITLRQLRDGDWNVQVGKRFFSVDKLRIVQKEDFPKEYCFDIVCHWDLAATPEPLPGQPADPDYTVGLKMGIANGTLYVLDMVRGRWGAGEIASIIRETAKKYGVGVRHVIEQEPGSSGKIAIDALQNQLVGFAVTGLLSTGKKYVRARPVATWVDDRKVALIEGDWNQDFIDELLYFSTNDKEYEHDDIVDSFSGGFSDLGGLEYEDLGVTKAEPGIGMQMKAEEMLFE